MNKLLSCLLMIFIAGSAGICMADAPHQVAGFQLGADISVYKDRVEMKTALPIRYAESIKEVEIKPTDLLSSGLIAYGSCLVPGKVLRVKLKYADSSKKFFDDLLARYKKNFGEPDEWRGDPFHIVIAWKWSFVDSANNRISLILQHNREDTDEKIGNSVKLTLTDAIDKERQCNDKAHPDSNEPPAAAKPLSQINWDILIPQ